MYKICQLNKEIITTINEQSPRKKYHSREWKDKKQILHWGQRKLFIVELKFLTTFSHLCKNNIVIYAGAAPGTHIPYLTTLYPQFKFILIDPNPFQINNTQNYNIEIINDYFTNDLATQFYTQYGTDILFISDIRTADHRQMNSLENEQYIIKDNNIQMQWLNIMKPAMSILKFRCPYPDTIPGKTNIYHGQIWLQPYAPPCSTETRLVIDQTKILENKTISYCNLLYEEQLFYHNTITRYKHFHNQIVRGKGLRKNWDTSYEIITIYNYLKQNNNTNNNITLKQISQISNTISNNITNSNRTLSSKIIHPNKRKHFNKINHRKFHKNNQ